MRRDRRFSGRLVRMGTVVWLGLLVVLALWTSPPPVNASRIVVQIPGNTTVQDAMADLQLLNCTPGTPANPCSLLPGVPPMSPPFTDIKTARVIQRGRDKVDFALDAYSPIPASPALPFLAYFFVFENGCIGNQPGPINKEGVRVIWNGVSWEANLFEITSCNPRTAVIGPTVGLRFTDEGLRVTVELEDVVPQGGEPLVFHAGVRRIVFNHPDFPNTVPIDVAPDVFVFNPDPPPPTLFPEGAASWEPR